jgi:hypothetical protein
VDTPRPPPRTNRTLRVPLAGGRVTLDYAAGDARLAVRTGGGASLCGRAGAGTRFDASLAALRVDNGGAAGAAAGDPGGAGGLAPPAGGAAWLSVALTRWTAIDAAAAETRRLACGMAGAGGDRALPAPCAALHEGPAGCAEGADACDSDNATLALMLVDGAAAAPFPPEGLVRRLRVTGASLLAAEPRNGTLVPPPVLTGHALSLLPY